MNEKLADTVYARLREGILRGDPPPGSVLDQRQLAESLASSRTPVREALRRLLQEGLVEVGSRRQVTVRDFTPNTGARSSTCAGRSSPSRCGAPVR